jgi:hypothetical protein
VPTWSDEYAEGYAHGFDIGYRAALATARRDIGRDLGKKSTRSPKPKRKASAYSKRYGAAFRKVAPRFKKKNGSWKTNGFKNAQKAAHKLARRK